ncbi:unnamed protein product [Prunus armeniaca]|uniref:Transposase MuDR plant domain-containing protein n=1 Tax=Prunus armeniaca TaxID=36596 RepID=A0A6J5UR17_PRUAR|nr:unnamed protein product [Prunus armeniaca]
MSWELRPKGYGEPFYGDEAGFSIQMYHNGEIRGNYYVNGMSTTKIDAMVKEFGHEGLINYWYSILGDNFDSGLVKLSEDAEFVSDTRLINIFLEHVLTCSQEQFYSQVASNIFINLDDDFGANIRVVIEELDDNYGAIVPVGLNQVGLTDEASKQGKESATVNNEENSDEGQEKPNKGCFDKGKGKDKDMSHRAKCAFGANRCGSLRRTKNVHHKDKVVEGSVDVVKTESKRHSMMLRSGRRFANVADFEDEDDDASNSEDSDYMIHKNFSEDEDEDDVFFIFYEWVDDRIEWTRVKQTKNEAAPDWPTDFELDSENCECKDYAKYNYDKELDKNWPKFNAAADMEDPKFEIGMLFTDCKVFRAAVREYSILQNRDVVFIRNEALKLKAVCGDSDCGWMIYASKMQHENTL